MSKEPPAKNKQTKGVKNKPEKLSIRKQRLVDALRNNLRRRKGGDKDNNRRENE